MSLLLSSKKQWRLAISKEDKFLIKVLCEERVICAKKKVYQRVYEQKLN